MIRQSGQGTAKFSPWGICLLATFLAAIAAFTVRAQSAASSGEWSPYQRVSVFRDDTLPPYLVADQNHTIHAFTGQWVGEEQPQLAIVYNRWALDRGWTTPVDILLSPQEQARMMGVFLDGAGIFHVIFFGGDDLAADIYYAWAPAATAGRSSSWSKPVAIGPRAVTPSYASLAGDQAGRLVVIYSGAEDGGGVYAVMSETSGQRWSEPEPIYLTFNTEWRPAFLSLTMGASGKAYAAWSVVNRIGHNLSGHFAHLDLDQKAWSEPRLLDQAIGTSEGMGLAHPALIEHRGEVFAMYNNGIPPTGVPPTNWYRRYSPDTGTWTSPLRTSSHLVGRNGFLAFVTDSSGRLHAVYAQRIPGSNEAGYDELGGVWHTVWQGDRWLEPEAVAARWRSEVEASMASTGAPRFGPYDVTAAISNGNVLLVTWRTDPGFGRNGVWYAYKILDSPELPTVPLPQPTVAGQATAVPVEAGPAPTATPIPFAAPSDGGASSLGASFPALFSVAGKLTLSLAPVMLLVLVAGTIGLRRLRRRRH